LVQRELEYPANRLSRVAEIRDTSSGGTRWLLYDYSGTGCLAIADYWQVSWKLDYFQGTAGTYAGYDRFGRVKDQFWDGYNSTGDVDRFAYTYDYAGNRLARDIDSAIYSTNNRDQTYAYDGLHRLKDFKEGTLSGGSIVTVR
jgi:hypothetical protein